MSNKQLYEKENNINKPFFPVVRLEDIIDTISEKSIQWVLNNYNHIYVEWKNDVVGTRLSVPTILRRNGLWITYNNGNKLITEYYIGKNTEIKDKHWQDDYNWEDYTNKLIDGTVEYRHLSESLKQLFNKGNVTNFPDEEDLTSDGIVLSFKNREYQPENFSGLGRVIFRKNIVNDKNILTQDMINKENTIYEIRYDFNLNGQEITIPESCVLDFQGGSLNNGKLILNNTELNGTILFVDIIANGQIKNYELYESWFGFNSYSNINLSNHKLIFDRNIEIDGTLNIHYDLNNTIIDGNKKIIKHTGSNFILLSKSINNLKVYNFIYEGNENSVFFWQQSQGDVERKYIEVCHNIIYTCNMAISLNSDLSGITNYCSIHDNHINVNNKSYDIGSYGIHLANANYTKIYNNTIIGSKRHALYNAWGTNNDIFNNKFIDNWVVDDDVNIPGARGICYIARGSNNINIYNNYFENGKNVDIHIYKGAYENRRSESPMFNINVYNNKFNIKKENKTAISRILVGYNNFNDEYTEDTEERLINIYNNSFYGDIPYDVIAIHSGRNIHVYNNNIYQKSDNNELVFIFSLRPYTTDRIENIIIETNTITIENNNKACVYFIDDKFNDSTQRYDIIIRNNIYNKHRLKNELGYKFSYTEIDRNIFYNIENEYKVYDIYNKSVDDLIYPDEYHMVNDVIKLHKYIKEGSVEPAGTLQCVAAGNPGVWYTFDFDKFDYMPYGNSLPKINYKGKKFIYGSDFKYVDVGNTWRDYDGEVMNINRSGPTSDRPTDIRKRGFLYFDTTINKPIYWTGSKWVDATGDDV